jgi:hypothetical protein
MAALVVVLVDVVVVVVVFVVVMADLRLLIYGRCAVCAVFVCSHFHFHCRVCIPIIVMQTIAALDVC